MKINLDSFNKLAEDKYLSVQKHKQADLLIWNYTQKCTFDRMWTPETLMARGLITDLEGNIKARPFPKFFNYEEHTGEDSKLPELPIEPFTVTDKLDGSLGILYQMPNGEARIATRGSFVSDQAIMGTKILHEKLSKELGFVAFDYTWTWLFEIIYPENRIVVDYGNTKDLFLLACINTETGEETPISIIDTPFKKVKQFDGITDISQLRSDKRDNAEGFVVHFKSGLRVKLKYEEYVRLHRLVTGVNAKTTWELLRRNEPFDELLERVPDEFYDWVKNTRDKLKNEYEVIEQAICSEIYNRVKDLPTRKEQAIAIMSNKDDREYSGVIFKMLDNQPYEEQIWKMIKPRADKPWKEDIDA